MKVAIITDQHFGCRNDSIHFLDFYDKFYSETFFPTLEKNNIRKLLILGDTFDRRKYVNFYTLKRTKSMFFDKLRERDIEVIMLAGNHDTYFKNTNEINSVDLLLQEYDNITVIDSPQTIHLNFGEVSHDVCMVPWICADNYERSMDEIKHTSATLCMGHFDISGFSMHQGLVSEDGLNREIFKKFDMVFSGHFHHRSSSDNIHYVGNPYEITWNDYNDRRGFHLFDLSDRSLEFIPNPNIMFQRITYDDKLESITEINNKDLTLYNNTYVKVVVVNKTNPYLFDKFMSNLYLVNPIDVSIVEDFTDLTDAMEDDILDQAEDTITIINKYVDTFTNNGIDNTKLKSVLREIYVEALNQEST